MTAGEFTSEAEDLAGKRVTLICGGKLVALIKQLCADDRKKMFDIALDGNWLGGVDLS